MKFKMKRITILIIYTISVTLTFGAGKSNDNVSESIVIASADATRTPTNQDNLLEKNNITPTHNYKVKNWNKKHTTSVPSYYVIQLSDSNDIEGAVRII
jgi:hypothetical protein